MGQKIQKMMRDTAPAYDAGAFLLARDRKTALKNGVDGKNTLFSCTDETYDETVPDMVITDLADLLVIK